MPFDVLPRHNIVTPNVQFYHPSPQLAEIALKAQQMRNDAILKSIDTVLHATDPINIAQRRMAMLNYQFERDYGMPLREAQAQYQMGPGMQLQQAQSDYELKYDLPYKQALAQAKLAYAQDPKNKDMPWMPENFQQYNAMIKARAARQQQEQYLNATTAYRNYAAGQGGQGNVNAAVPPGTAPPLLARPADQQDQTVPAPVAQPSAQPSATPQTISGGNVTDSQGNILPPAQQGVPTNDQSSTVDYALPWEEDQTG